MRRAGLDFYKALFEELNPDRLPKVFLELLLETHRVERGSIWVKRPQGYVCLEAAGAESEAVKGLVVALDQPSVVGWVIEHGEMTIAEAGKDPRHFKALEDGFDQKSSLILCLPLILTSGEVFGAVQIIDTQPGSDRLHLEPENLELLQTLVDLAAVALSNALKLRDSQWENERLKDLLAEIRTADPLVGQSPSFRAMRQQAANYARTDFPVLILGESGTGKELLAREIHQQSLRAEKPFLVQNCSAIPDTLLESELFGYKKGAFSGASRDKVGLFEAAHGGTVFLDEIGDMPLNLQARILRVLQSNEVKPLGAVETKQVDIRILAATNKDLAAAIAAEEFREDLYYRLNVLPLDVPPLRERPGDPELLAAHFMRQNAATAAMSPKRFAPEVLAFIGTYPWPGNVRELENVVRYLLATTPGEVVGLGDLPPHLTRPGAPGAPASPAAGREAPGAAPAPNPAAGADARPAPDLTGMTWDDMEKLYVMALMDHTRWNISRAAEVAGLKRSTFASRMKRLGISKS